MHRNVGAFVARVSRHTFDSARTSNIWHGLLVHAEIQKLQPPAQTELKSVPAYIHYCYPFK